MTISEMLQQSAVLTFFGMTVVFIFLWFMIVCVNWVGKLVHKMGWDKDIQETENKFSVRQSGSVSPQVTAAISAAVSEYQQKEEIDHV
ncbi:OadG family protein [Leadbettera azotonutricia]|uniref:Oxaloacetate decarboxylase, gamma subunit n=1 Tax=Leadbettera azotonutricia (strain ATCC BAA-888 / DSM 13862 / ZAS-9) TaxID=545695 RepID=F5YE32_LEAAZ|nr:OadG family protein [Leadbettera azotonutricia]AEF83145.1 oxaloacetate decarboxylase, gamma subunit [Leadbettera azotonutricia ZAS-9]